jgi:hypothetical protein
MEQCGDNTIVVVPGTNALVRQPLARTSAAPGKTRLANFYRVQRGSSPPLVDAQLSLARESTLPVRLIETNCARH